VTAPRKGEDQRQAGKPKSSASAEAIAFLLLGGVVTGIAVGGGLDYALDTFPLATAIGVFAGFAVALYAVYLETK
jgi:F0F1-type ATP synthase assembly protein I